MLFWRRPANSRVYQYGPQKRPAQAGLVVQHGWVADSSSLTGRGRCTGSSGLIHSVHSPLLRRVVSGSLARPHQVPSSLTSRLKPASAYDSKTAAAALAQHFARCFTFCFTSSLLPLATRRRDCLEAGPRHLTLLISTCPQTVAPATSARFVLQISSQISAGPASNSFLLLDIRIASANEP